MLNKISTIFSSFANGASSVSNFFDSASTSVMNAANYLTPAALTNEYWQSEASTVRFNGFFQCKLSEQGSCQTRLYHLTREEKREFNKHVAEDVSETQIIQYIFRDEYKASIFHSVDSILAIPSDILPVIADTIKAIGYVPYAISKSCEYVSSGFDYVDSFFPTKEAINLDADQFTTEDVALALVASYALIN